MKYNKIIAMPVYKRLDCALEVLEGIKRCYGSEEYVVIVCAEPGYPEVVKAINSFKGLNIWVSENTEKLGTGQNIFKCLSLGFNVSDFVVIFEDDVVPAKDCLKYIEWARDTYENDQTVFNVATYNRIYVDTPEYYSVEKYPWFTCYGWGIWKDRWENEVRDNWKSQPLDGNWTDQIQIIRGNRVQVRPLLSRSQNIGFDKHSVHIVDREIYNYYQFTPYWVDYLEHKFNEYNSGYKEYILSEPEKPIENMTITAELDFEENIKVEGEENGIK